MVDASPEPGDEEASMTTRGPGLVRATLDRVTSWVRRETGASDQVPALTGLRAMAAWLVFVRHTELYESQPTWLTRISKELHVGVTIFFVLSGFLITLRYYDSSRLEWSWFRGYLRNRVARIYPVYLGITLVSLVVYRADALGWFLNLTLLGGFTHDRLVVGPAWTLTVEECFYFSAPLLFFFMRRGFVWGVVFPLTLAASICTAVSLAGLPDLDPFWFVVHRTYAGRILEFVLGAQIALLVLRKRVSGRGGLFTYGGLAWLCGAIAVLVLGQAGGASAFRTADTMVFNNLFAVLVLPWGPAFLILGLVTEETWIKRQLSKPLFVLCGKASYVFYLIHFGFVAGVLGKLGMRAFSQFFVLNLLALAAFAFYEEPLRNLIRGKRRTRREGLAPA